MRYPPPDFPPQYAAEGFYGIMKLGRYRAQYKQAVLKLAWLVKDTADRTDLVAGSIADFNALDNAFASFRGGERARRPIRITVAAYRNADVPHGRDPYYYGRTAREWAPYRGAGDTTPIASFAERLIADLGHDPVVQSVDDRPPASAESPSVLIVDPWAGEHPVTRERLRRIDEDPVNVLVPVNEEDAQTVAAADRLSRGVDEVLGRGLALPGSARAIPSLNAFRAALAKAVAEATNRYFKEAAVHPPEVAPSMSRPTLQLPDR